MSWNLGKTGSNTTPLGPRKRMIGDVADPSDQHERGRSSEPTERSVSRFSDNASHYDRPTSSHSPTPAPYVPKAADHSVIKQESKLP